jgi:lipopolysaccharide biosynthesis regulator YciM
MEADDVTEALNEIEKGLAIAETSLSDQESVDLRALGLAWKARVIVESGRPDPVEPMIDAAMRLDCRPWIKHRVNMAAGDIAMKENRFQDAYDNYQKCLVEVRKYGGEGHDYQIAPRLSMACIRLGHLEAAERHLSELKQFAPITIGHMYLEYCRALLARAKGENAAANDLFKGLRSRILAAGESNILLKLIDAAYDYAKDDNQNQKSTTTAGTA